MASYLTKVHNRDTKASYLTKVHNRDTKARCGISPKSTIKTQEQRKWRDHGVVTANPKFNTKPVPAPLLLTLSRQMPKWYVSCYYPNNQHLTYPHNNNGFNFANYSALLTTVVIVVIAATMTRTMITYL